MKSETSELHKSKAPNKVSCGVITLSDSKYRASINLSNSSSSDVGNILAFEDDKSGAILIDTLNEKYDVDSYSIIPDDSERLEKAINEMISKGITAIFTTGGTGISKRDITIETLNNLFEKELPGFGEIFRAKSYDEIGASSILSRASAGVYNGTLIFAMPGSPNAVKNAISIVINELGHLAKHVKE
ncbi:MAG: MogA/MoaB family molybdenum cofactor biosynthesis protein [Methanobacteriaceae archaeon]